MFRQTHLPICVVVKTWSMGSGHPIVVETFFPGVYAAPINGGMMFPPWHLCTARGISSFIWPIFRLNADKSTVNHDALNGYPSIHLDRQNYTNIAKFEMLNRLVNHDRATPNIDQTGYRNTENLLRIHSFVHDLCAKKWCDGFPSYVRDV